MFRSQVKEESVLVKEARKAGSLDKVVEHNAIREKENQRSWNEGMAIGLGLGWGFASVGALCGIVLAVRTNRQK